MSTERWTAALAASDYQGWVVYVDGAPIFEAASRIPRELNRMGGLIQEVRQPSRNILEWDSLPPHTAIERLELYFGRETWPDHQPIFDVSRLPGSILYYCQFKRATLVAEGIALHGGDLEIPEADLPTSPVTRTGIEAYIVGCYDPAAGVTHVFEVDPAVGALRCYKCRENAKDGSCQCMPFYHPCWPRPQGLGISPHVFGFTPGQIPEAPELVLT